MVIRLAHRWLLRDLAGLPREVVAEFLRPAVRAVPRRLAARLGPCEITVRRLDQADSRWRRRESRLEIELAADLEPHDLALELLLCLGQALWDLTPPEAYLRILDEEIRAGVPGEIDEAALAEKAALLSGRISAGSRRRLRRYAAASFAGTVAEYIHALWHDVTVRTGPEHLPAAALRHRLEWLARWFPPDRGYRLFAAPGSRL